MSNEMNFDSTAAPGEAGAVEQTSETRQYVTFMAGDEVFAVEMAPVQEIIRVPDVVRVPLAPPRWKAWQTCVARCYRSYRCAVHWALSNAYPMTLPVQL